MSGLGWVVAGMGAVAGVGTGVEEVTDALFAGRSALAPLRGFDHAGFCCRRAYEIDDRSRVVVDEPGRATRWLIDVIAEAVKDAGLGTDLTGVPVVIGTGLRELRSVELWWTRDTPLTEAELDFAPALRERFGADTVYTFSNACSASLHALALAADMLSLEMADTVVVAGTDAITASMSGLLDRVQLDPPDRVRPFDRARKGALMGDGAAAVVLCRAPQRHVAPRAWLRAVALTCDAYHLTAPDPRGIAEAMQRAHRDAGIEPGDVDLVLVHGTGTWLNDQAEGAAIRAVFGSHARRLLITGIKGLTGHTSGGSGLLSLIVAARALATGRIPAIAGLDQPDDGTEDFGFVRKPAVRPEMRWAQVDAFGFGGVNAVALVEGTVG